jgi:hypothetical protein
MEAQGTFQTDATAEAGTKIGTAFIPHPLAVEALESIDDLFTATPSADGGWCGLLTGPTGSGKSAVLRAFCSQHKPTENPGLTQPVLSVALPDKCNTRTLSEVLLTAQRDPAASRRSSIPQMQEAAVKHLIKQKTRLVIFDEAQHAIRGKSSYEAANFFKHIVNQSKVNVLLAGLPSTAELLDNDQLESRTMISADLRAFDWWNAGDRKIFRGVLKQMQAMLRYPVLGFNFTDEDWAWRFSYGSRGLMRPIVKFLMLLERRAEREERTMIAPEMLAPVWARMPKKEWKLPGSPFELKSMPKPWKPADASEGDRA